MRLRSLTLLLIWATAIWAQGFVVVEKETLFWVPDEQQAEQVSRAVESIARSGLANADHIFFENTDSGWCIGYDTITLVCYPKSMGAKGESLAQAACFALQKYLASPPKSDGISWSQFGKFIIAFISPVIYILILLLLNAAVKKLTKFLLYQEGKLIKGVKLGNLTVISARDEVMFWIRVVQWTRTAVAAILFYVMLLVIFRLYPGTQNLADSIIDATLDFLKRAGVVALRIIAFGIGAFLLYLFTRVVLKIVDLFVRHYQSKETLSLPAELIGHIGLWVKVLVVVVIVVIFFALIPGEGNLLALSASVAVIVVIGLAAVPFIKQYFAGFTIFFNHLIRPGDRVFYQDRWWEVEQVRPLYVVLRKPGNGEQAVVLCHNLLEGGIIRERKSPPEENQE